jgi:hypothetical protein
MAVAVVTISAADWLSLGLEIVGFCPGRQNVCLKTNLERFRAHFGVSPENQRGQGDPDTGYSTARLPGRRQNKSSRCTLSSTNRMA